MELLYIDDFIYQIIITIHLLVLMFGLVYVSGKLWAYFLNKIFEVDFEKKQIKLSKKQKKLYADF